MSEKNLATAIAYYQAMNNKDLSALEKYLHPEVRLIGPLADITGKDAVLGSVKHLVALFNKLIIRAQFGAGDRVMLAYDMLLTFQNGLIIRYELFFDARPFEKR
jgi:hypothetical protein